MPRTQGRDVHVRGEGTGVNVKLRSRSLISCKRRAFSANGYALFSFVEAMDRCWIERRSDDLSALLALTSSLTKPMARLAWLVLSRRSRTIAPSWCEPRSRGSHRAIRLSPSAATPRLSSIDGTWNGGRRAPRTRRPGVRPWCSRAGKARGGSSGPPSSRARLRGLGKQCGAG